MQTWECPGTRRSWAGSEDRQSEPILEEPLRAVAQRNNGPARFGVQGERTLPVLLEDMFVPSNIPLRNC